MNKTLIVSAIACMATFGWGLEARVSPTQEGPWGKTFGNRCCQSSGCHMSCCHSHARVTPSQQGPWGKTFGNHCGSCGHHSCGCGMHGFHGHPMMGSTVIEVQGTSVSFQNSTQSQVSRNQNQNGNVQKSIRNS